MDFRPVQQEIAGIPPPFIHRYRHFAAAFLCLLTIALSAEAGEPVFQKAAVATVHPLATDAAVNALKKGGNAIDAAVAAALTLGVVDGHNSGIGGGCFLLIRTERGSIIAIDGRETAPAKAYRDMFLRNGKADPELSQVGALAIGIPGSLAAYEYALKHFGNMKLRDVLLPAAEIAENGFKIDQTYAARLAQSAADLKRFEASRQTFLKPDGKLYAAGETLKQPELAKSYRAIAEQGIDWFYGGPFAEKIEQWMIENDGLVSAKDFKEYRVELREPVRSRFKGYEILGFPPPSSGGVHVAQILNIIETFELSKRPPYSAASIHLIAESMKLAFADRAHWLGDPDFVKVPRSLIGQQYAAELAKKIDPLKTTEIPSHGAADQFGTSYFDKHTTHFSTADADGNWVACTATVNTSFGSKVVIPGTGIVMNNQMDDFSAEPGVPNFFGLVGTEANAVEPGKRPLSSMSPTIVLANGRPILSLGAAGGPTIISQTVVNLINILGYGMTPDEALRAPRIHHQWRPDQLRVEKLPAHVLVELEELGHDVQMVNGMGAAQVVWKTTNGLSAAHDPRVSGGKASGL